MHVPYNTPIGCFRENRKAYMKNKHLRTLLITLAVLAAAVLIFGAILILDGSTGPIREEIALEDAQALIDETFSALPSSVAGCAKYIGSVTHIRVTDITYGENKDATLLCTYETVDVLNTVLSHKNEFLSISTDDPATGKPMNATKVKLLLNDILLAYLQEAETLTGTVELHVYETQHKGLQIHLADETVDTVFGGILSAAEDISATTHVTVDGEVIDIENKTSLKNGVKACFALVNYDSAVPDTTSAVGRAWNSFKHEFHRNFIEDNRWTYLASGLGTTLAITFCALLLGVVLGFLIAIVRCTNQKTGRLKVLNAIAKLYLSVIRGTPVMVQLLILYFVCLLPIGVEKFPAAVLCFGINSAAYVAEIVRGGIMAVDEGQSEAGRSLGLNYIQTMWYIVIPQAFKAVLPSLANEFITLLKESSVAFYIGVADLTQGGLKIRSITYSNFMPLVAVAVIYLVVVLLLSYLVSLLERRLRQSER